MFFFVKNKAKECTKKSLSDFGSEKVRQSDPFTKGTPLPRFLPKSKGGILSKIFLSGISLTKNFSGAS